MSTRGVRAAPVRGYRRRKTILDLNREPPGDNQDQEGTSIQVGTQNVQGSQQGHNVAPATIDSEDEVVESSPRAFDEAKKNARRNRIRDIIHVDSEGQTRPTRKRRRNYTFINLENNSNSTRESTTVQPKEPTFSCPICLRPLKEEMSTKCGHIFCKECITVAITAQGTCPSCRQIVHLKELIRVYLPSTC